MDALVPPDVTAELTQILSNLVLGDNEIRSKYVFPHFVPSRLTFRPVQRPSSMSASLTDQMSISLLSPSLLQERTPSKWSAMLSLLYPYHLF
jgi:hypothetical protein